MNISEIEADILIQEYDNIVEEYKCMQEHNVIKSDAINIINESRKNIGINKLATIVTQVNRHKPTLKMNIGKRCCIKGIKNKTLNIIKQGQELPCHFPPHQSNIPQSYCALQHGITSS